jgi:hypothetical protein
LQPSPEAARSILLRRLAFNLTGLPPTLEQLADFVADDRPDAVERLVDNRSPRPRTANAWPRHRMDVARYSDTKGYVFFEDKNYTWAYTDRDDSIEAFNPRFARTTNSCWNNSPPTSCPVRVTTEMRTGPPTAAVALGFLRSARNLRNNHDIIDDRIDVATRGLLGLTVTCGPLSRPQILPSNT